MDTKGNVNPPLRCDPFHSRIKTCPPNTPPPSTKTTNPTPIPHPSPYSDKPAPSSSVPPSPQPSRQQTALSNTTGKTTTTEFTILNSGPATTNPHDPARTPGGSSAGSAAAVSDFQVPIACGTQTGGSVIRPAAYTGTFAMDPSFNTVSGQGVKDVSLELDSFGYFARSIEDLQLVTDVFDIVADRPVTQIPLQEAKVGVVKSPFWNSAGPGTIAAMERAAQILRSHGVTVEDVDFPSPFNDVALLKDMFKTVLTVEVHTSLWKEYLMDTTTTQLSPEIRGLVENANTIPREEVRRAYDGWAALRSAFHDMATKYDVLVTPSAADEAPVGLGDMGDAQFNFVWTVRTV
jgi:Asp-tRNA(Asn)/Glu-tRNA(Gln) amidotransferase A subunit family amidase